MASCFVFIEENGDEAVGYTGSRTRIGLLPLTFSSIDPEGSASSRVSKHRQ